MTVHVVGAGLAGLAAAVRLASGGARVALHEAAPQAGGRCRSYHDAALGRIVDNGSHLMLAGNRDLHRYLEAIDAEDGLIGPEEARFPFLDMRTGERWDIHVDDTHRFSWLADPTRDVPGAGLHERLAVLRLAFTGRNATVKACLRETGSLWERFWEPMATAVLNTPPERASARLLKAALRESFAMGGAACRPLIAKESLAAALIDPALAFLGRHDVDIGFGHRVRAVELSNRAEILRFTGFDRPLGPEDHVILALPPAQVADLLPGVPVPKGAHPIVNAHFAVPGRVRLPGDSMLLGLIGGTAQWLFLRDGIASITVSAADRLAEEPADTVAAGLWAETAKALGLAADPLPAHRVIKEKRATFSQTPAEIVKRPSAGTRWSNLHLAGDWTDTSLPATIEGAVRSGHMAADAVLAGRAAGAHS